ncbi:MAG: HAD-IIA family hydrolase [Candidatus Heimdallarchaeota archaeon]|nr:HAD-IIA family hydrolase [Candidatus Heimdallarchaeota archaeon]MCK5049857.1 HAD-IIA family hydrolase [Candidatus Heimdallarchaeota archaeon]
MSRRLRKEFEGIELFAFDGDGVIYRGAELLPGAEEALTFLNNNFKVVIITNNSTTTTDARRLKLEKLGINLTNDQIISSASATATYLAKTRPQAKKIWVIGEQGLRYELAKKGFIILNEELGKLEPINTVQHSCDLVVVGMDRKLTYDRLAIGCRFIRQGAEYIATNVDQTFPIESGVLPGAGSMIAALSACVGKQPAIILGKPESLMYEQAMEETAISAEKSAFFGDRLETDILGANRSKMTSVLVYGGIASKEDLAKTDDPCMFPDIELQSLLDIFDHS